MHRAQKRRYLCTETASAVPKYFPHLPKFCTGYRIWHASQVWKRKTSEKHRFAHSWKYPDTTNTFSLFVDEILQNDLRPIYCSVITCCVLSPWRVCLKLRAETSAKLEQLGEIFWTADTVWLHGYLRFEPGAWKWNGGLPCLCADCKILTVPILFKFSHSI